MNYCVTTKQSERLFSSAGYTVWERRTQLSADTVDKMIFEGCHIYVGVTVWHTLGLKSAHLNTFLYMREFIHEKPQINEFFYIKSISGTLMRYTTKPYQKWTESNYFLLRFS